MSEHEHPFDQRDIAARKRAVEDNLRRISSTRPRTNNQGKPLDPPKLWRYDSRGMLLGPVDDKATPPATRPGAPRYDSHGRVVPADDNPPAA